MNALDRLKEIEALVEMTWPDGMIQSKDVEFLLRAVRVYREIASGPISWITDATNENQTIREARLLWIDKEFEERMKAGEKE